MLARLLTAQGHPVSYMTVAQLLHDLQNAIKGMCKSSPSNGLRFWYARRFDHHFDNNIDI